MKVLINIISRSDTKKIGRYDMIKKFNDEISDSRLTLNQQQFSKILKTQPQYVVYDDRIYYIFEEKMCNKNIYNEEEKQIVRI